jgi:hypothetical protein
MSDASLPEPPAENIDGSKAVSYSHEVHHKVNWGYIAIGLAVIAAIAYLYDRADDDRPAGAV